MKLKRIILSVFLLCATTVFAQEQGSQVFKSWAPTPPMGWNSWDCYGPTVEEKEVKANADYMAKNLKQYGWNYVVVDIRWFVQNDKAGGYNEKDPQYVMDEYGRYMPAVNRFPSAKDGTGFKHLADYVHSKGLKFGIHIMRGIPKLAVQKKTLVKGSDGITADQIYSPEGQCKWLRDNYTVVAGRPGAQAYYNSLFELYASWGLDFIKIDDLSSPYHTGEIEMIRKAIDQCGRPIVLSMSPGPTPLADAAHACAHANMWREVNDVWDTWKDIALLLKVAPTWYPYIQKGNWPDCDMIPLGRIAIRGERGEDRMTRLTKTEQYTLMNLFTISKSPLMFGGDLPSNDAFTTSLLTNRSVLKMHRESERVRQVYDKDGVTVVTSVNPNTKEVYVALFNANDTKPVTVKVDASLLGVKSILQKTEMWQGRQAKVNSNMIRETLQPHASKLYSLKVK